jgi:hypothetical protein
VTDLFEHEFIGLLSRGLVKFVELFPAPDGWYVRVNGFQWLRSRQEAPHRFDQLERTLRHLHELGCPGVMVSLDSWPSES